MADNTLGSVQIVIVGDWSRLKSDFAAAEQFAARAGASIATSFNQGAVGSDKVVQAVQQLGTTIQQESAAASLAWQRNVATLATYQGAVRQVGAAHAAVVPQMSAVSGAVRTAFGEQSIRAVERFVTMIPGVAEAIQTLFPVIGAIALVSAIDRVIDKVIGLKAAEQALSEATREADSELKKLSDQGDAFVTKSTTERFGETSGLQAQINLDKRALVQARANLQDYQDQTEIARKALGGSFGEAFGVVSQTLHVPIASGIGRSEMRANADQIKTLGEEARKAALQVDQLTEKIAGEEQTRRTVTGPSEGGKAASARIQVEEQSNTRLVEIAKQRVDLAESSSHAAAEKQIAAMHDPQAAAEAAAREEVRIAQDKETQLTAIAAAARDRQIQLIQQKAGAESAGKSAPEQGIIATRAQGEIGAARDKYTSEVLGLQKGVADAQANLDKVIAENNKKTAENMARTWEETYDGIMKAAKETSDAQDRAVEKHIETLNRVAQIQARASGDAAAAKVGVQRAALEAEYADKTARSRSQEIEYLTQLASLIDQENTAKLSGLALDLQEAEASGDLERIERTRLALVKASAEARVQEAAAQGKIAAQNPANQLNQTIQSWQSIGKVDIGADIANAIRQLPQSLGSALAGGLFHTGKGGMDIGKQVGDAMRNLGKNLLGQALTQGIEKLVAVIATQVGLQAAFNAIFGAGTTAQVASTTANTVASGLNTAALAADTSALYLNSATNFFADGTDSAPGGMAMVGERGPEIMYVPRGASIIPNHKIKGYASGTPDINRVSSYSSSSSMGDMHLHFHGISHGSQVVDHVMRELPRRLKTRSPQFSPYSA